MSLGRDRRSLALTPAIRAVGGVLGVAVFAAGVVAVFVTENGAGAAALLAIGAGFMVIAVLGDRVQSVELGGVNLTIRDLARETYALAREAENRGDDESAARLRTVASQLEALARGYRRLRGSMRAGAERTRALEHVMTEARRLAKSDVLEAVDVLTWFEEGTPEARITALGLMQGNPRLRDFEAVLDAIGDSRSAFEQYHGLRLAEMMVSDLTATQRAQLVVVTERAMRSYRVRRDSDRHTTGERLLTALRDA
jgi:hypothetical protein